MNTRALGVLALAAAIGIFFWYVNPTWTGTIADLKTAIAADDSALAAAARFEQHKQKLAEAYDSMSEEDKKRLNTLLPDSPQNIGLIIDLNALAAEKGITVSNINVDASEIAPAQTTDTGAPAAPNSEQPLDVNITAVGTYSTLKAFLSGLAQSGRLLDLRELSIQGSDTGVYTYGIRLRTYWLR